MNSTDASPHVPQRTGVQRRWTVQLASGVLGLQAAFFIGIVAWFLFGGSRITQWEMEVLEFKLTIAALWAAQYLLIFGPLSLLVLAAILLVWLRPRAGWVFAMALQCIVLFLALEIYFIERADDIVELPILYLMMLGGILIVIFLNSPEGRLLLVPTAPPAVSGPTGEVRGSDD
jgi:hypothetical protein